MLWLWCVGHFLDQGAQSIGPAVTSHILLMALGRAKGSEDRVSANFLFERPLINMISFEGHSLSHHSILPLLC